MSDSFGRRLRRERERREISLTTIVDNTKISMTLLEGLERDDVSRWPAGIFRRSFLRLYAEALGLDAEALLREFLTLFPDPQESPRVSRDADASHPVDPMYTIALRAVNTPYVIDRPRPVDGPRPIEAARAVEAARPVEAPRPVAATRPVETSRSVDGSRSVEGSQSAGDAGMRLTLAESWSPFVGGLRLVEARRRGVAAAWDLTILIGVATIAFAVFDTFWLPLGISSLLYYVGGILILGNTPGVCLFGPLSKPYGAAILAEPAERRNNREAKKNRWDPLQLVRRRA